MPVNPAGMRTDLMPNVNGQRNVTITLRLRVCTYPPMSVPIPMGLPRRATKAPSPPDDPPGVSFRLNGLVVRPNT